MFVIGIAALAFAAMFYMLGAQSVLLGVMKFALSTVLLVAACVGFLLFGKAAWRRLRATRERA